MAERTIHCTKCNLYLGVIRDANLRKGMSHICEGCETSRKALEMKEEAGRHGSGSGFDGLFDDTFGEIFGGSAFKK